MGWQPRELRCFQDGVDPSTPLLCHGSPWVPFKNAPPPPPTVSGTEGPQVLLPALWPRSLCLQARELLTQLTQKGLPPMEPVPKALWLIILSLCK